MNQIQLISCRGNQALAQKIANFLKIPLTPVEIKNFASSEIYVRILQNVRNDDIFVIQSFPSPVNEYLTELLITIDTLKRASAGKINVIAPFLCYSRQDRKIISREPISAKLVANLLTKAGADRLVTVDLHTDQVQGFYDIPVDHLIGYPLFAEYLRKNKYKNLVIVAPDIGAVKKATKMASLLSVPLAVADKRRKQHNQSEVTFIIGEVKNKTAVILDDIIDTAGTVTDVAELLKKQNASQIIICGTHGLLNGNAIEKLKSCPASEVILTDTVPIDKDRIIDKIKIISFAPVLAKVIKRIHEGKSLGELFIWDK